jgi:hypothetical protein
VQVTESRVFALSDSGRVYVIPAQSPSGARQSLTPTPAGTPTATSSSSSTSRWGSGWLWGDDAGAAQYAEIVPAQKLAWGER